MENETDEQFEERVLNKRAAQVFHSVKTKLLPTDKLLFTEVTIRHNRKQVGGLIKKFITLKLPNSNWFQAAQKFYSLLVLKKFQALELQQDGAYEEIIITKGAKFENPTL